MKTIINWFLIPSSDLDRAIKFYSTILDLDMIKDKDQRGYEFAHFSDPKEKTISGGIGSNPEDKPSKDGTRIFLNADGRLESVLEKVEDAGGKVVVPRMDIGEHGFFAMINDTEDNMVGLHSNN